MTGGIYYSNTTLINGVDPLHPLERVRLEGCIHPYMKGA